MRTMVAMVTLDKSTIPNPMINQTITESIRAESIRVEWTPHHVVFHLYNGNVEDMNLVAYRAEHVIEVYTEYEEDQD